MRTNTTAYEGISDHPTEVIRADSMSVYAALIGAIVALAGAIAVLWRRSERRAERQLKAADEAREREVKRADDLHERQTAQTALWVATAERQAKEFSVMLDKQRAEFGQMLHDMITRQTEADRTRDAATTELIQHLSTILDATQRRMIRTK